MFADILIMIAIALGGFWLFKTARRSRKEYEEVYGGKTTKQKLRMGVIFTVILALMLAVAFLVPESRAFFIGGAILAGCLGVFPSQPGVLKDVLYSALLSSLIAGFVGVAASAS